MCCIIIIITEALSFINRKTKYQSCCQEQYQHEPKTIIITHMNYTHSKMSESDRGGSINLSLAEKNSPI